MNGTLSNVFHGMMQDSISLANRLVEDANHFTLALEAVVLARRARDNAKEVYAEQEAGFLFDMMFSDEDYTKAKNAEAREVVKDAKLIKARTVDRKTGETGPLYRAWSALSDAQADLDKAEMTLAQADARFKSVRVAADLHSNLMRCAAASAESVRL